MLWYAAADEPLKGRPGLGIDEVLRGIEAGNVDWRHDDGTTPLMKAAKRGDAATVGKLLKKGARVNAVTRHGAKAIDWAAAGDHIAVVRTLLDHGAATETCGEFAAGRSRRLLQKLGAIPEDPVDAVQEVPEEGREGRRREALRQVGEGKKAALAQRSPRTTPRTTPPRTPGTPRQAERQKGDAHRREDAVVSTGQGGGSTAVWFGAAAVVAVGVAYALDRKGHLDGIRAKLGVGARPR